VGRNEGPERDFQEGAHKQIEERGDMDMESEALKMIITVLLILLLLLLCAVFYVGRYRMARVYNWNGGRYCYLGYVPIRRKNGNFVVRLGESVVDLAHTTDYRICPGKAFCRKNRYRGMIVYAERKRNYLVIDYGGIYFKD